jgi:hypothetical protein
MNKLVEMDIFFIKAFLRINWLKSEFARNFFFACAYLIELQATEIQIRSN